MSNKIKIEVDVNLDPHVQDFVILFASIRRDGRSLGQMAKDELGAIGGTAAMCGVMMIMIICKTSPNPV